MLCNKSDKNRAAGGLFELVFCVTLAAVFVFALISGRNPGNFNQNMVAEIPSLSLDPSSNFDTRSAFADSTLPGNHGRQFDHLLPGLVSLADH